MSAIRKWIASKMFTPNENQASETGGGGSAPATATENGISFFRSFSRNSTSGTTTATDPIGDTDIRSPLDGGENSEANSDLSISYFSTIYNHYKNGKHKLTNEKNLISDMYQFYYANEELNFISSELDSFDGRKDTDRCSILVNSLKLAQDRVITLIFRIMDEIGCERASREYRLKFPDELLLGEGIESLNSQIWFGAEFLAAGSTITNNQAESNYLRPIANNLTSTLEQVRYDLRICCNYLPKCPKISKDLIRRLENFDKLFTSFEYDYVKAMLPIKSSDDIESLQELTYLFSDTLTYALGKGLISKEDVDGCQPNVMIALPRLSLVRGLLQGYGSVVCKLNVEELSSILRPYHSLLLEFHEFLTNLGEDEIFFLEQLLSTSYENNDPNVSDFISEPCVYQADINGQMLNTYNKFLKCVKKIKNLNQSAKFGQTIDIKISSNKYISASVDLLHVNNKSENCDESSSKSNRYSPLKPHKIMLRFLSLPNINLDYRKNENQATVAATASTADNGKQVCDLKNCSQSYPIHSSSSISSTNSSIASSSNSYPTFSMMTSSSSASSISIELDFMKQFKDILKRTQAKANSKNRIGASAIRSNSSNCPRSFSREVRTDRRAKTTNAIRVEDNYPNRFHFPTPTTSAFSTNSIHFDLDSVYFDDISQLATCTKRILHQVFVMLSKVADKFQTNYASELRNILRTVFLLHEMDELEQNAKNGMSEELTFLQPIDVQIGQYSSNDSDDLGKIEEGIDANEYLSEKERSPNFPSTSQSSPTSNYPAQNSSSIDCDNCDTCDNSVFVSSSSPNRCRSSSLESPRSAAAITQQLSSSDILITSSSCPTSKNPSLSSSGQNLQSLPSVLDGRHRNSSEFQLFQPRSHHSTSSSLGSSQSPPQSQFTNSTTTTIDEQNCADLPTFIYPGSGGADSFMASHMPILGTMSGPSPSNGATNLLLPPIWIPDELATTCKICTQVFNIIRRRHHCRRCGQIFCHQCSNNFVSLKCFGYAKPVRVCNSCLVLHLQSINHQHLSSRTPSFGASS